MDKRWSRCSCKRRVYSSSSSITRRNNRQNKIYQEFIIKKQINNYTKSSSVKKNFYNIMNKIGKQKELNACEYIYKKSKNEVKFIRKLYKVKDCSILKYGIKKPYEKIKFTFCKTCDKNLINPICEACVSKCHKGHRIKQIIQRDNIICTCGKNLHKIKYNNNDYKTNCLCYEWSYISKLNIYYKNFNKKYICYFCYMMCNDNEKNKLVKFKKNKKNSNLEINDDFSKCSCDNDEVHGDAKTFVDYILKFFENSNQMKKILHPNQIINMIFKSKKCFSYIFFQLEEFIKKSKENSKSYFENFFLMDITCTTIYYSLKLIKTLINKTTYAFYCKEIDDYFSFNIYKSLILSLKKSNVAGRSYWIFCRDFTFLFYKLYINKYTRCLIKLKIDDIQNLTFFQRITLFHNKNENEYIDTKEITKFLLSQVRNVDINKYNSIESIEYIKNIVLIFKKFTICNLLSIDDMMNISSIIEVIFNFLNFARKSFFKKNGEDLTEIEFKIYGTIMKMILAFIYNYNDKITYNILSNNEKYPSFQFITGEKINFLFKNNKLCDLINKITIRVISILTKYHNKKQGSEKYKQIVLNSIKILDFSLSTNDKYMENISRSIKYSKDNDFGISKENNMYYKSFLNESNNIEKYYSDYLNFIITEKELLDLMNKSLDEIFRESVSNFDIGKDVDVLDIKFTKEKNDAIIITQLFYGISKLFNIIFKGNKSEEKFYKKEKTKNNLVTKILIFYFIFAKSSPDNPALILSSYFLTEVIKLPIDYNILIFKLFNECFKIISANNRQLSNIKYILNILYNYLEQNLTSFTINKLQHNENECLFYYFEIIKIVIYEMKIYRTDNSALSYIKIIIINIIKELDLFKIYCSNKKNQILSNLENYDSTSQNDIETINKIFITCIKLINDIFDFSSEKEREIINSVVDIEIVISFLLNFSLDLRERTEFIRFTRKILIDISYCDEKENYYTSFIINKKDNLSYIKNNELISNLNYPTKLFSFIKDFYSLSKFVVLKEKIKRKINKYKNENENEELSSISDSNKQGNSPKILPSRMYNEESQVINDKGLKKCPFNKKITFTQMCKQCKFYSGIEKSYRFFRYTKKSFSTKKSFLNKSFERISTKSSGFTNKRKSLFTDKTPNELKRMSIFKSIKRKSSATFDTEKNNDTDDSKSIPYMYKSNNNYNYVNDNKTRNKRCSLQTKNTSFENQLPKQNKENKFELKEKDTILLKNNNIYYYSFFDYDFYRIIKFELDNYLYYTSDILLNNKNDISLLKDYFENGLLIPIIYYFKRVFLFIHKYTGEEVMKIYDLIEKSLNLKIYISEFSSKLWDEDDSNFTNYNESDLIENENINKKESYIDHVYFTNLKYIKNTNQTLDELRNKNYSCFDYTFLYKIIEKEFINMLINRKNLSVFDSFYLNIKKPNIITDEEKYYNSLILKLIQIDEKKIENYENKTDAEKKLIRIYFLYKYNKNHFLRTIKELSLFNIFDDICLEFQCNYKSLLLAFLIEDYKENDTDIYKIKNLFLYILLLYKPNEIQSNIKELLGGVGKKNLGFIFVLFRKLSKKLILSIIDYLNPFDKIDYSNFFFACILIAIFKLLGSQYNFFSQYHLVKFLSFKYSNKIPERFMIKIIKNDLLNNTIKGCSYQSSSDSENSIKYELVDYFNEDNYSVHNPGKTEIDFFDFFLCLLLRILLMTDNNESRYELLNKHHLYLYNLFHIILDLLIATLQENKTITIKNRINYHHSIIKRKKTKNEHNILSSINLNKDNNIEIYNSLQIFIDHSLEIIFDIKMDMELFLDIKYKLLLFLISIIENQSCNKETQNSIINKLKTNQILNEIGKLLKAYYIYEEEIRDAKTVEKNVKLNEKLLKLKKKVTANFKDHRVIDVKMNNHKKNSIFVEMLDKTRSFGRLSSTINMIDNSKLPLFKSVISNNGKNEFINKLNKNHINEEISENYKANNSNTLNKKILKSLTYNTNIQNTLFKNKNKNLLHEDSIINQKEKANRKIKELLFDEKLCDYFLEKFYKNDNSQNFTNNTLFKLSNILYRCLKKIAIQEENEETVKIIKYVKYSMERENTNKFFDINIKQPITKNIHSNKLESDNKNSILGKSKAALLFYKQNRRREKNDNFYNGNEDICNIRNFIEQFYIVKFFESITSTVEIRTKEDFNYTVIFTKVPELYFLSIESKNNFLAKANRKNGKMGKKDILQNIDYFNIEIYYYKNEKNSLAFLFSKIFFQYFEKVSYYFILIFNLFLLFTLKEGSQLSEKHSKNIGIYNEKSTTNLQNKSLNKWGNYYKFAIICNIIINLIVFFLWICFRFPLDYKLEKRKYINKYKIKKYFELKNKLFIIFYKIIFRRKYIFILLYEIIFSATAAIFNSSIFIVISLLPIILLNNTLYSLIKVMKERTKNFFLVSILLVIAIYIFSNFSFFFFKNDYEQYIDNNIDNVCNSLLFCFLNAVNYGLRTRGGINEGGKNISFLRHKKHYIGIFLLNIIFFLLIIIIMKNLIFGIIIHSFLDKKNGYKKHLDEDTRCYICKASDDTLKKYKNCRINNHKKYVHNIWSYIEYIISLKKKKADFLNYIDSYVIKQIEKKNIAWLPTQSNFLKKYKKIKIAVENDEFEILDETKLKKFH